MRKVYFDYSATSPVKSEVLDYVMEFFTHSFGNPSSVHNFGVRNKDALLRARNTFSKCINAKASEIYFTSGGTESDNWALKGIAQAYKGKGNHIITTKIEHPAVLNTAKKLEAMGYELSYLDVNQEGLVDVEDLKSTIRDTSILVSIIFVNNEIGTIQNIKKLGEVCRKKGVIFHSDAVQAFSNVKIDVNELPVDLLSFSAHKFYALKGTGALYIREGVKIDKLMEGGSQEKGLRPGTENVAGIVAMAKAAELASENLEEHIANLTRLRDYTLNRVMEEIPDVKYNGHPKFRHPGNLHFSFKGVNSTALLIALDRVGIAVSAGSACSSGSLKPSHVLSAISLSDDLALSSIRISMGDFTDKEDCDYLVNNLKNIVEKFRNR